MTEQDLEPVARAIAAANSLALEGFVDGGAFKQTYLCQSGEDQKFALKLFDPERSSNERHSREIDAMRRCRSPHIAQVLDAGIFDSSRGPVTFLIEEYLGGGTLEAKLAVGPLTEIQIVDLAGQIARGLEHLWRMRLVHRDIKPENIMYREEQGAAVLVDLGLVRDLASTSLTATWLAQGPGTPAYAAPEQLNNDKAMIDWRTDQFSMGVVLVVAATGCHPFMDHSKEEIAQAIPRVAAREPPNSSVTRRLSSELTSMLNTLLEPWPVQRYTTPSRLLQEIEGVRRAIA